ncbi:MAG: L,D-transpeptidase [Clostridia bacterium]|nr:L,D-transpeptidase [Clostridia bacterium]
MKSGRSLILLLTALLLCIGCGAQQSLSPVSPEPESTMQAQPHEGETVVVHTPEPVITIGEMQILTAPSDYPLPEFYTSLGLGNYTVYAFSDREGNIQYRAYCGYTVFYDGKPYEDIGGIYPVTIGEDGMLSEDAKEIDPFLDEPGVCTAISTESLRLLNAYTKRESTGLISYNGGYLIYGAFPNKEPAFYPANADGSMIAGALPYEGETVKPDYYPDDVPKADGTYLLIVYLNTQTVVGYRSENGDWSEVRRMICSSGRAGDDTPTGSYKISEIYEYKQLGMSEESYCYAQYASRITGHYLFHSTPIWFEAGRDSERAKTMVKLSGYEHLGEPASDGCIRLTVADAKWIYDNCGVGTEVRIGLWDGPIASEPPAIIYEQPYMTGENMGWDPTDPDPDNPYHEIYGVMD